jgi:hypothetical protein
MKYVLEELLLQLQVLLQLAEMELFLICGKAALQAQVQGFLQLREPTQVLIMPLEP